MLLLILVGHYLSQRLPRLSVSYLGSGILASEDQVMFDKIRDELTHSYDIPYLSNRLLPNLEQFAFKPWLWHPCLPHLWYNNCNKSYNNVIKRDTNWVIQKLLDLVTKLYELEQDQTRDVRGALFDKDKYVLSKQAAVLIVSYKTWTQLLPEQRSRRLLKFLISRLRRLLLWPQLVVFSPYHRLLGSHQSRGSESGRRTVRQLLLQVKNWRFLKFSFKSSNEIKL